MVNREKVIGGLSAIDLWIKNELTFGSASQTAEIHKQIVAEWGSIIEGALELLAGCEPNYKDAGIFCGNCDSYIRTCDTYCSSCGMRILWKRDFVTYEELEKAIKTLKEQTPTTYITQQDADKFREANAELGRAILEGKFVKGDENA